MPRRVSIFDVPIDAVTLEEACDRIHGMLSETTQHHILTPNPEMLVVARSNPAFRSVLQSSSLNVPDGCGLLLAAFFLGSRLPERVAGIDLLEALCMHVDVPVFLLGAGTGIAERAADALVSKNPALKIVGTYAGSPNFSEEDEIVERVNRSGARVLFVAYGAPRQDLWIARNLKRMPAVSVAMGVGGSFDFLAGVAVRAPGWMRSIGLEWLWRLAQEPTRSVRIFNAVVVFPLLVLLTEKRHASS